MKIVLAAALLVATTPALAAPNNWHGAVADSGDGCIVSADGVDYAFDPACSAHGVAKYDADGTIVSYSYQDKGTLQDGQTAPSSTVRNSYTATYNFSTGMLECDVTEVVAPSGNYSSNAHC